MMPDGLYDRDALAWSEQQADLLRRLARGERVNDAIDWKNVIEEVGDVGLSQLNACTSLWEQAMLHLMKLYAWPESGSAEHWTDEVEAFLDGAARRFSPSMRQRIDLDDLYRHGLGRVRRKADRSGAPRPLPDACPFTIETLLGGEVDVLLAQIDAANARRD